MKTTQSKYFERFDRLFDDIHENIANGDSEASDNLSSAEKLREVKLWVTGYVV